MGGAESTQHDFACTELEVFRAGCLYIGTDANRVLSKIRFHLAHADGKIFLDKCASCVCICDSRFLIILSFRTARNAVANMRVIEMQNYVSAEKEFHIFSQIHITIVTVEKCRNT